ncbi:hypothetical protein [Tateyamaria sp.]|uniref:hypothetical protein n=1 Tax=Tateyamaria sp. TaxID=1929288 RepID=UPI0032A05526
MIVALQTRIGNKMRSQRGSPLKRLVFSGWFCGLLGRLSKAIAKEQIALLRKIS